MSLWSDYEADYAFVRNCMRMIGTSDDFYYVFEAELKKRGEVL